MKKTVIFDFDGTIADSIQASIKVYNSMANEHNLKEITEYEIMQLRTVPLSEKLKLMNVSIHKIPLLYYKVLKNLGKCINEINVFDGITEVLQGLRNQACNLAIISSNSQKNIQQFLTKRNIDLFDDIISSKNLFGKDHTINNYIKSKNLNREDVFYVGDEVRDINACKKCNVKIIAVTWGFELVQLLKKSSPDYIAYNPIDIYNIILDILD